MIACTLWTKAEHAKRANVQLLLAGAGVCGMKSHGSRSSVSTGIIALPRSIICRYLGVRKVGRENRAMVDKS